MLKGRVHINFFLFRDYAKTIPFDLCNYTTICRNQKHIKCCSWDELQESRWKPHVYKTLMSVNVLGWKTCFQQPGGFENAWTENLRKHIESNHKGWSSAWHSSHISASLLILCAPEHTTSTLVAFRQGILSTCPDVYGSPFQFMTKKRA